MIISTAHDFASINDTHPWAAQLPCRVSLILPDFFRAWRDQAVEHCNFHFGRQQSVGVGSIVKYDSSTQSPRSERRLRRRHAFGLAAQLPLRTRWHKRGIADKTAPFPLLRGRPWSAGRTSLAGHVTEMDLATMMPSFET